ncbi:unnamed protein product, partial [Laminaria digitata]
MPCAQPVQRNTRCHGRAVAWNLRPAGPCSIPRCSLSAGGRSGLRRRRFQPGQRSATRQQQRSKQRHRKQQQRKRQRKTRKLWTRSPTLRS